MNCNFYLVYLYIRVTGCFFRGKGAQFCSSCLKCNVCFFIRKKTTSIEINRYKCLLKSILVLDVNNLAINMHKILFFVEYECKHFCILKVTIDRHSNWVLFDTIIFEFTVYTYQDLPVFNSFITYSSDYKIRYFQTAYQIQHTQQGILKVSHVNRTKGNISLCICTELSLVSECLMCDTEINTSELNYLDDNNTHLTFLSRLLMNNNFLILV